LGDGTTTDRTTPVDVVGLDTGVTMVSAGGHHTCALTTSGTVSCWGDNSSGQLGDGTTRDRTTPVDVVGLAPDVTMVTAGNDHTCAVTSSGTVKCWGDTVDEATPFDVDWLGSDVTMVSAGNDRTCALTTSGAVKCWGYNVHGGHLADGALDSGVSVVSAGFDHTCAVTSSSGAVTCWGYNSKGQLGDGTTMDRVSFTGVTPVNVVGLGSDVTMVSAGDEHTCALTTSGTAQCWGDAFWGQLGDGTTTNRLTPVDVVGLGSDVTMVSAGGDHTCAVTSSGTAKCWGSNFEGQLGDGTTTDRSIPVDVEWLTPAQALLRLLGAFVLILLVTTPVMLLVKRLRGARRIKRAIEDLGEGSPIEP